jgi:hypothetical protein
MVHGTRAHRLRFVIWSGAVPSLESCHFERSAAESRNLAAHGRSVHLRARLWAASVGSGREFPDAHKDTAGSRRDFSTAAFGLRSK